jgi:RNA polymerase-binding transcription factor DksA
VIELWWSERVSEQQAIGKILLLLREIKEQIQEIEERLRKLERGEVAHECDGPISARKGLTKHPNF